MRQYSKLQLLVQMIFIHTAVGSKVYITPSLTTPCPNGESCYTLSTLAANTTNFLDSNTTLIFLAGNHTIEEELIMSHIEFLTLYTNASVPASIMCSVSANINFINVTKLQISRLEFVKCINIVKRVDQFTLEYASFHGGNNGSALQLTQTNAKIGKSSFISNVMGTYQNHMRFLKHISDYGFLPLYIKSYSARVGGALVITNSNLEISSSHFRNNMAKVGGAIFAQLRSGITIRNCTFVNNSATGCNDRSCHGGALFVDSGCTVKVDTSTFANNTSGYCGGAIALFQGTLTDNRNIFICKKAGNKGPTICAYQKSSIIIHSSKYRNASCIAVRIRNGCNVSVYNSSFDNINQTVLDSLVFSSITLYNSSFYNNRVGGIMYAHYSSVTVYNSSFKNNKVGTSALLITSGTCRVNVYNSSFENNEDNSVMIVFNRPGGSSIAGRSSSIAVYNSSFNNNKSTKKGVMYALGSSDITVYSCSFDNNEADMGGVMYSLGSTIIVYNSSFHKNKARNDGGVVYASGGTILVYNSSFHKNEARNDGGVMYVISFGTFMIVYNSSFHNNEARDDGGVMYAYNSVNVTIHNSSFHNNNADNCAGVFSASEHSNVTTYTSSFDNNWAGNYAGVASALYSSTITIHNSSFHNNMVNRHAGVIYAYCNSNITVHNSSFNNNVANTDGGVIFETRGPPRNSKCTVGTNVAFKNGCTFVNNSANRGGVVYVINATLTDFGSVYHHNVAHLSGGVITLDGGVIKVSASSFVNNTAENGGVLFTHLQWLQNNVIFQYSYFCNNTADTGGTVEINTNVHLTFNNNIFTDNHANRGGVIYLLTDNIVSIYNDNFFHNSATSGGVIYSQYNNKLTINNSKLNFNVADIYGGAVFSFVKTEIIIAGEECIFIGNHAKSGGVLYASESKVNVLSNKLKIAYNTATETGGAIHLFRASATFITEKNILFGNVAHSGGVLYADVSTVDIHSQHLLMASNNTATQNGGAVHLFKAVARLWNANSTLLGNEAHSGGVIYARESKLDVCYQNLLMANNIATDAGGAVYLSKSNTNFVSSNDSAINCGSEFDVLKVMEGKHISYGSAGILVGNKANYGGAMYVSESNLLIETCSQIDVTSNTATHNGGGLYLTESQLRFRGQSSYITRNRAGIKGGGLHAENSSIIIEGTLHFTHNEAENGGGVSLEKYAKIYGISIITHNGNNMLNVMFNTARRYGGAVYVDDETNPDMCTAVNIQNASSTSECFSTSVFVNWWNNSAGTAGSNLFGGLLDRCKVHNTTLEGRKTNIPLGLDSFLSTSNINETQLNTVSSHPLWLCFCRHHQPDCDYQPDIIQVNRGKSFAVELIAYDQVREAVNASIQSSLSSSAGGLGEGQNVQQINGTCTELQFDMFSPHNLEELTLSIRGPCNVLGISRQCIMIEMTCICPIGFQKSSNIVTSCECVCDKVFQSYLRTQCNATSQAIIRKDNFWVAYVNNSYSNGTLLIYPNCPYDYCHSPEEEVHLHLNIPKGSDAQCAANRSGTLCGSCKPSFSVSLGSSSCLPCPTYWPGLLVAIVTLFILSGICLVISILVLNLTVAIGTINTIIFYANIVAVNKNALLSTSRVSFASVFISWLNFDFGFDICIVDGMDMYVKTWLQLAFPAYIVLLVALIILLSYHFTSFARIIGKKDPIATLATLILLSYAKLLQIVITAFSSATLDYSDNLKMTVWLPDASVVYFSVKHAVLFFVATIIMLVGLVYTSLLLTWQCLLSCPRKRVMHTKISYFLEMYQNPYMPKHRYWTGVLLLVRVLLHLVSGSTPSNDPRLILLSTSLAVSCLVMYMTLFGIRIYKNIFINAMEIFTYFNILATSMLTWYSVDSDNVNQVAVTNISVGITFTQLILIISYHAYKHMNQTAIIRISERMFSIKLINKFDLRKRRTIQHKPTLANSDIHYFFKLDKIDRPGNTSDHKISQVKRQPTKSVVELPTLEELKAETELESQHWMNEEDSVSIPEENTLLMNNETEVFINNSSGNELCPATSIPEHDSNCQPKVHTSIDKQEVDNDCLMPMPFAIDQSEIPLEKHPLSSNGQPEKTDSP